MIKKKIKRFIKKITTNNIVQAIVALIFVFLIKLIFLTCRAKVQGKKHIKVYKKSVFVGCMWHGRTMGIFMLGGKYLVGRAVTSKHRDGRIMSKILEYFGMIPIYGSTTSGALSVLREGLRTLKNNKALFLTPDGPKGPRMRLQDGAIYFAKMSGCPLVPICFSCKNAYQTNFWDKYLLILPFSKVLIEIGEPFYVPRNIDNSEIEEYRKEFEKIMIEQQNRLDDLVKRPRIKPEPVREYKRRTF